MDYDKIMKRYIQENDKLNSDPSNNNFNIYNTEYKDLLNIDDSYGNTIDFLQDQMNAITLKINSLMSSNNDELIDFLQNQLNVINKKMHELIKKQEYNDTRYLQIIKEIDYITLTTENNHDNIDNNSSNNNCGGNKISSNRLIYVDTSQIHKYVIKEDVDLVFITMAGGGGAGGIGFINGSYYYSGGGGGAGASYVKIPLKVKKNDILYIKIGKGGDIINGSHGENTYIELVGCENKTLIACGGKNGNPSYDFITKEFENIGLNETFDDKILLGGDGGSNKLNKCFSGDGGEDGIITTPSQLCGFAGNGGPNNFYRGGIGGHNYFHEGGKGGEIHNNNFIGEDGKFGSGGGGTTSILRHSDYNKLSGYGGDGFLIIEF